MMRVYLCCYLAGYARTCGSDLSRLGELMVPLAAARLAEGGSRAEKKRLLVFVRRRVRRRARGRAR